MMKGEGELERRNFETSTSWKGILVFDLDAVGKKANLNRKLFRLSELRKLSTYDLAFYTKFLCLIGWLRAS